MKLLYEKEIITENKQTNKPGGAPIERKLLRLSPPPLSKERAFDTNQVDWHKAFSLQAKSVPSIRCVS